MKKTKTTHASFKKGLPGVVENFSVSLSSLFYSYSLTMGV